MYPEERVLVGVVNRKRDLNSVFEENWYRIPEERMPDGVHVEYLAFFLSGRPFKAQSGGIHYFARVNGFELKRRRDLLPKERDHPRAGKIYYRVALGEIFPKKPPILNPQKRVISFIFTTWDRFSVATEISDLYSDADRFVERITNALRRNGIRTAKIWNTSETDHSFAPGLRVDCADGAVDFFTEQVEGAHFLDDGAPKDQLLQEIRRKINAHGGPVLIGPMSDHI
jgi:hypothetical protein